MIRSWLKSNINTGECVSFTACFLVTCSSILQGKALPLLCQL
ncbi:sugar phosphate permease domain protein [Chlamydia muridarum]|nr:sugar phosphate permease domain protein [Chlamydia muridarum]KDU81860.1 sugar phosphate permease domain protein [Chlamydia muridarum]KDU82256.1 sugar phosphate permease domain protein [Chlamydia muridarum]KDU83814.1 sugar phosphate permease domain protein [Chlamydia muridarum]KDU84200.1 sugar phosphate permease domain protein [Chlamydia muridarum]